MDDVGSPRSAIVEMRRVSRRYPTAAGTFAALDEVDLVVERGEYVAVVGRSGSGKSTLLNVLTGIDRPTGGTVTVAGTALHDLGEDGLARWRREGVGIVFQFFQLLPTLTVLENVVLPMDFRGGRAARERDRRARELLDLVGVGDQAAKVPAELSGGQQQRVAIARALANDPPLLVADEPTGNLDSATADRVLEVFGDLARRGTTLLLVSHDRDVARRASRVVELGDGRIVVDRPARTREPSGV
jgi:putative ABC transport system ATP-binding protein